MIIYALNALFALVTLRIASEAANARRWGGVVFWGGVSIINIAMAVTAYAIGRIQG